MPFIYALLALLLLIIIVVVVRTILFSRGAHQQPLPFTSNLPELQLDPLIPARHLSAAIQIPTVSHSDPAEDRPELFDELHQLLQGLPLFPFMKIHVTPLATHPSAI